MKVKDIVSLKGCYSAHDVGQLEVSADKVLEIVGFDRNEIARIIESWESYKDGLKKVSPEHYYQMNSIGLADAIISAKPKILGIKQ